MQAGGCGWIETEFWLVLLQSIGQLDWPVMGVDFGWRSGMSKSKFVMLGSH